MHVDTIAAISTAAGPAALGIVRLSGPGALDVLRRVAPSMPFPPSPRHAQLVRILDPRGGAELDRALVTVFPGPASYTGEDVVEISGHGGWLAPALVLEACVGAGARRAEPGEFTRRAYLNGRMDLVQAEAVLDLVEGRSRALHDAALRQLDRGLSARVADLRERLLHLEALLAHHIDFPDEDEPPVPVERIVAQGREVADALGRLLATAPEGELLREGALTVLAGRPNSGKSSLFNALLGEERAIVTEVPGTTRDANEAVISLGGYPFRLVDTAGIHQSEERVERLGMEVARRFLGRADLVLLCVAPGDEGAGAGEAQAREAAFLEEASGRPMVIVRTKADLVLTQADLVLTQADLVATQADFMPPKAELGATQADFVPTDAGLVRGEAAAAPGSGAGGPDPGSGARAPGASGAGWGPVVAGEVSVSSVTGAGLDALKELLPSLVYGGLVSSGGEVPVLTRARQSAAVRAALEEVTEFNRALGEGVPAELAATHLRQAEGALEELLGVIPEEEVLDRLFQLFCIGK